MRCYMVCFSIIKYLSFLGSYHLDKCIHTWIHCDTETTKCCISTRIAKDVSYLSCARGEGISRCISSRLKRNNSWVISSRWLFPKHSDPSAVNCNCSCDVRYAGNIRWCVVHCKNLRNFWMVLFLLGKFKPNLYTCQHIKYLSTFELAFLSNL